MTDRPPRPIEPASTPLPPEIGSASGFWLQPDSEQVFPPQALVPAQTVLWPILANAVLWTAGNSLTTGPFLNYFATDLGLSGSALSLLITAPELVGVLALATRDLLAWVPHRKRLWLATAAGARAVWLLIPLIALLARSPAPLAVQWGLVACVLVGACLQSLSNVLYHTWLADLIAPAAWGPLFSRRNAASIGVLLIWPLLMALLRQYGLNQLPAEAAMAG